MKKLRKLGAWLLCLCMVLPLIPVTAFAADTEEIWVNGVNIVTAESYTVQCGSGTAVYDPNTKTITLHDAAVTEMMGQSPDRTQYYAIVILSNNTADEITLRLEGQNTVSAEGGIYANCNLKITGTAADSLQVNATGSGHNAICIFNCGLKVEYVRLQASLPTNTAIGVTSGITILSGADVSVSGGKYCDLSTNGILTISGSKLTLPEGAAGEDGMGISADGGISIQDHSVVKGTVVGVAVKTAQGINISDSEVDITSTSGNVLNAEGSITINEGSQVTVKGYYPSLWAGGGITINGAVNAISTNECAIYSKGTIAIGGTSDVHAVGTLGGIKTIGNIEINGGTVYAKSSGENTAAILARYTKTGNEEAQRALTLNENYGEISGGKLAVSEWWGDRLNRSWTSFIAKDDASGVLAINGSSNILNALKEVTIKIKSADYSAVDEAIAKADELTAENYEDFSGVTSAIHAVDRNKNITEQNIVDGYAAAIESAIAALTYKAADYSRVDAALGKIPSDLSQYTDESVQALNEAKNAVTRGKNITEQSIVDGYAEAIENAVGALTLKSAPPVSKPKIIRGASQSVEQGKDASFTSDADFEDFLKVIIDGKELSSDSYTIKKGSTIVTLKAAYVKTLSEGKHTIGIVSANGQADAEFTVVKSGSSGSSPSDPNSPQTGDSSHLWLWLALLLLAAGTMTVTALLIKNSKRSKDTR